MHIKEFFRKVYFKLAGNVVYLRPKGKIRGNVLLSYIALPFFWDKDDPRFGGHSSYWEARCMAQTFLDLGYRVDVIEWTNALFTPKKPYIYFIDIESNMERLTHLLNNDCIKIFHVTHADAQKQNDAERNRITAIKKERGVTLAPGRTLPRAQGIIYADVATALSDGWSLGTYAYAHKRIHIIPISTTHMFPFPSLKDFPRIRTHFVWYGGGGAALKGLDLVLIAFAEIPEYSLTICGKAAQEKDFMRAFHRELFETPNIRVVGHVDPNSEQFKNICQNTIAMIHPSFSEGASGSVILTMHAGLIPIVSRESSVHTDGFGIELPHNTVSEIKRAVIKIASMPEKELRDRAEKTWVYARAHHTRQHFAKIYREFVVLFESEREKRSVLR